VFTIGTINLLEIIPFMKTTNVGIMDTNMKTNISKHGFEVQSIEKKIPSNRYEPEIALEDKVFPELYYNINQGML
jgi:hypothetical protein